MQFPKASTVGLLLPPILLTFVAFVLAMIALLAGTGPQQKSLEPYHIIAVNMTNFGQDLIASANADKPKPSEDDDDSDSLWDKIKDGADDLGDKISGTINNITNDLADDLIEELGISEWYSIHIMTACQGMFVPDSKDVTYNLTNCTAQQAGLYLNLTDILDHEVEAGPLNLNINQIPIPETVQDALDIVNDALLALLVFYAIASGIAGLSFFASIAMVALLHMRRVTKRIIWANVALTATGALALLIASAVVTFVNNKGAEKIDHAGRDVGITAIKGAEFMLLSWITFGLMAATSAFWGLLTLKFTQRWVILNDEYAGEKSYDTQSYDA
ncbi:actin cortical patch SUR7/pH-response regulator pali [Poronia punctata]|nr:actin cortical patch SUR7/pH-response regulator pali [Poronia punctata]